VAAATRLRAQRQDRRQRLMLPAAGTMHAIEHSHYLYSHYNDISHQLTMHQPARRLDQELR
jgi:hypothetical protein